MKGWHLDKDIICSECKIYSPETCAFVPPEINGIFTNSSSFRGKYPIGVYKQKNRFLASINTYKSQKKLGSFLTYEEAFQTYKIEKEKYIKEVADKWKDQLDPRVHKAMYNYQVEITD
jgi:hypothetical protein